MKLFVVVSLVALSFTANAKSYFCADGLSAAYIITIDEQTATADVSAAGENQGGEIKDISGVNMSNPDVLALQFTENGNRYQLAIGRDGESTISNIIANKQVSLRPATCYEQ